MVNPDTQDSEGYDIDETGQRIDSDHNMFLRQDLAAMYGECTKCGDPLNANGVCSAGCEQ